MTMPTLFYKETCPFCQRVLQMAENLQIDLELKDVLDDPAAEAELLDLGGKQQVPFLVDSKRDVRLYEANDIIEYLREHYAGSKSAADKPRIHTAVNATCVACEG